VLKVGLTGGIGAGKSAVAELLVARGAVLVDADVLAREVVDPGTDGLAAVVDAFGAAVLGADGALDRAALARIVFADTAARGTLESIIHPRVRRRAAELAAAAPGDAIVVNDVPLLVETGQAPSYHLVIVVETDPAVRRQRLVARGMAADEAAARIAAQASDDQRRAAADVVLDNSGGRDRLAAAVTVLWQDRLVPYERRVRQRQPVRRPEHLAVVAPDPSWPDQYRRLAARLRHAVGIGRLDHVGSTAVPGLPAKDVLDMQLVVPDLVAADRIGDTLAAAGFPAYPGEWWDESAGADPAVLVKRLHGAADPGRLVHLHVRAEASPAWRVALLFRDWLRAVPAERDGYAARKRELAAAGLTTSEYADAKSPWVTAALTRAESWATDTGWQIPPAT
jgi:dephospho-CoA kinase